MKKTLALMFGISVVAGAGYMIWAFTGLGKFTISRWLLKQWKMQADKKKKEIDLKKLEQELSRLNYEDHELLFWYTWLDPMGKEQIDVKTQKRMVKLLQKMKDTGLFKRASLSALENIVLPG